jgi:hypothetical protein
MSFILSRANYFGRQLVVHLAYIEDNFYIKGRGQLFIFSKPYGFSAVPGNAITLFSPDNAFVITGVVDRVEKYTRMSLPAPSDPIGIYINGLFMEQIDLQGWMIAVHMQSGAKE